MLNKFDEIIMTENTKEHEKIENCNKLTYVFGDPLDMSVPDKIEYERWIKYARKHHYGSRRLEDKPDFFDTWQQRAWLGLALLESTPPQQEIAIEILKTIVKVEPIVSDEFHEYLWELKINGLYALGMAVWQTSQNANQALQYLNLAMDIVERSSDEFAELARGEVFYARLLMFKELGQLEKATKDIVDKTAKYDRRDDRTNSFLFFASLFKADLAKEQGEIHRALVELQTASKYFLFLHPEIIKIKETLAWQETNPEKVYRELREMMVDNHNLIWEIDGPYARSTKEHSQLYKAIEGENTAEALRLIALGAINDDEILLLSATRHGDIEVVEALLKAGQSPNEQDRHASALVSALNEDQPVKLVEILLQAGADPNEASGWGIPLIQAINYGSLSAVELLLKAGANVNQSQHYKETPILAAASQPEILKTFIAAGADLHCQNKKGQTPLLRAAAVGCWASLQLLWQAGVDKSLQSSELAMAEAIFGGTSNHIEVVTKLIELGVDVRIQGEDFLRLLARSDNTDMIALLIKAGVNVNNRFPGIQGRLQRLQWDSDVFDRPGVTALSIAAQAGQLEVIKLLLSSGCVVDSADNEGITPLMYACNGGHNEAAQLLLEAGGDINAADQGGETPTDYAQRRGSYLTLDVLEKAAILNRDQVITQVQEIKPIQDIRPVQVDKPDQNMNHEQIKQQFDGLVGIKSIEKYFQQLARTIGNIQLRNQTFGLKDHTKYNLIIEGETGSGKYTMATIYAKMLFHYGITKGSNIIVVNKDKLESHRNLEDAIRNQKGGVVYLADIDCILPGVGEKKRDYSHLDKILRDLADCQERYVFIIAGQPGCRNNIAKHINIEKLADFSIMSPEYSLKDYGVFAQQYAADFRFQFTKPALKALKASIEAYRTINKFENFNTVKMMLDNAMIINAARSSYEGLVQTEFIKFAKADFILPEDPLHTVEEVKSDPFAELDALVGLHTVKERVREITAYVAVQKQRNKVVASTKPICLHMAFTGSPGTGKTTVARIIGKIFKKLDIFAKGHFVEASRVDLVGTYIGHTAVKTSETIKRAADGVLFIDEAYSLYPRSDRDFGHEAVATLIKEMEDQRERLAVIFAGYSEEMEQFIGMNPGLRDRIQFKIDFPDFNSTELLAIFDKLCAEDHLNLENMAREMLAKLFESLSLSKSKDFANGRLVRKCFERLKLAQATRLFQAGEATKENLVLITAEDVQSLYSDLEITKLLTLPVQRKIGFD